MFVEQNYADMMTQAFSSTAGKKIGGVRVCLLADGENGMWVTYSTKEMAMEIIKDQPFFNG